MEPQVTFVYKDGFRKQYSRKVAEVLEKLGRGKIEGNKPAVKVESTKPVETPKVEAPKPVEPEEVFKPVAPPVEPAKRRGRPPKA